MKSSILGLGSDLRFYYYQRPVFMGKGINGLRGLIENEFGMNPKDGSVFVFISKNHKEIRLLHYDKDVFTLYIRKIFGGRFIYPIYNAKSDTYLLDWNSLRKLIRGYRYTRHNC